MGNGLTHLKPVAFNVYKQGRKSKLNPDPGIVVEQKRGVVIGWQESPSGNTYVSIRGGRKKVYCVELKDVRLDG